MRSVMIENDKMLNGVKMELDSKESEHSTCECRAEHQMRSDRYINHRHVTVAYRLTSELKMPL